MKHQDRLVILMAALLNRSSVSFPVVDGKLQNIDLLVGMAKAIIEAMELAQSVKGVEN